VTSSKQKIAAAAFLKFMVSPSGQRVLRDHGLFPQ
jgi:ABC-type glycerol-3-phosphate transport system substrate-binding protein